LFSNFLRSTFRNLVKYKGHTLINITCLMLGIVVFLMAFLWIYDELKFDRFHENYNDVHRVIVEKTTSNKVETSIMSPAILGDHLTETYPEVINSCRLLDIPVGWLVETDQKKFRNDRILSADPSFFSMFSFPLAVGNTNEVMPDNNSIIISNSMAEKYFGNENPIGKTITIEVFPFQVTGLMEDVPAQSHLQFDCVIPYNFWEDFYRTDLDVWDMNFAYTYLQFAPETDANSFFVEIATLIKDKVPDEEQKIIGQPLKDIHLRSNFDHDLSSGLGSMKIVRIFSLAAFLVLLIAIINYMNLSTAHSALRAKEIGVKKIIGASRKILIWQILGESFLFVLIAFVFSLVVMELILPSFNTFIGKSLTTLDLLLPNILLYTTGILCFTALVGGIYPAIVISKMNSLSIIKSKTAGKAGKNTFRKMLVIAQYSISLFAIIAAIVISQQMNYINKKDIGFDRSNVLYFIMRGDFQTNFDVAKSELLQYHGVESVSLSSLPYENSRPLNDVEWSGKETDNAFISGAVGIDHFKTFGMDVIEGRSFNSSVADSSAYIVNETAARLISEDFVIGKQLTLQGETGTIIGVVKDYHHNSLHQPILPKIHSLKENIWVCVRIKDSVLAGSMAAIRKIWDRSAEGYPFEYNFLDEDVQHYYGAEKKSSEVQRAYPYKYHMFNVGDCCLFDGISLDI